MDTATIETSVQQRAFELFVQRGATHGSDQDDWFRAEQDLRDQTGGKKKSAKRPGNK